MTNCDLCLGAAVPTMAATAERSSMGSKQSPIFNDNKLTHWVFPHPTA